MFGNDNLRIVDVYTPLACSDIQDIPIILAT